MSKRKRTKEFEQEQKQEQRDREAILDERENLEASLPARLFARHQCLQRRQSEVMFKLTIPQARSLAWLLKEHHL